MRTAIHSGPVLLLSFGLLLAGCYTAPPVLVQPYETCGDGDACAAGLVCADTTLPASTGFTGAFCTSGCNFDEDCLQLTSSFESLCVNEQCYLTCPSNQACPYGQGCLTFQDQGGTLFNLCTP